MTWIQYVCVWFFKLTKLNYLFIPILCFSYHNREVDLWCTFQPKKYYKPDTLWNISVVNLCQHDVRGCCYENMLMYFIHVHLWMLFEEAHFCNWFFPSFFQLTYLQPKFVPSIRISMFHTNITWSLDKSKWALSPANICFPILVRYHPYHVTTTHSEIRRNLRIPDFQMSCNGLT